MYYKLKFCPECHTTKRSELDFSKDSSQKDGRDRCCKECHKTARRNRNALQRKNRQPTKCPACGCNVLIQMHHRDTFKALAKWICGWCKKVWERSDGKLVEETDND